jgi:hypothetical protein
MLVTLPFVLLLASIAGRSSVRLRARTRGRGIHGVHLEKLPLLALSAGASVITFLIAKAWRVANPTRCRWSRA